MIKDEKFFLKEVTKLLSDQDFDNFEIALSEPNIFSILHYERKELMHSNILAYLLNPNENHGIGTYFLQKVLVDVFSGTNDKTTILDVDEVNLSSVEVKREWKNIDILIIADNYVIAIENKIDSQDGNGQLDRYCDLIKNEPQFKGRRLHFVYLTPTGANPQKSKMKNTYMIYSYYDIAVILLRTLEINKHKLSQKTKIYINDYLTTIRRDLLMSDELNKKAEKFYLKHQNILDFIYDHKPDLCSAMHKYLKEELEKKLNKDYVIATSNKGSTRFYPKEISAYVDQKKGTWWSGEESFAFELIYYDVKDISQKIKFLATIACHKPEFSEHREKLISAFKNIDHNMIAKDIKETNKWVTAYPSLKHFNTIVHLNPSRLLDKENDEIVKEIKIYIDSLTDFVDMVTKKIKQEFENEEGTERK